MNLAEQILNRQQQVQEAVNNASDEFLFYIINNAKDFDIDFLTEAVKEWEKRKEDVIH